MKTLQSFLAEFIGTFVLVFIGCGSAVLAGSVIGNLGVALAFGFALLVMAYAVGSISGCHINPAVSFAFLLTRKMGLGSFIVYVAAQLTGAALAGITICLIASGKAGFDITQGFATNGFGDRSPEGYNFVACLVSEIVTTAILVFTVLSTTRPKFPAGFGGIAVGVALTIGLFVGIPVTNGSLNPARSFGVAIYEGSAAIGQLWFFFVMPLIGATFASLLHVIVSEKES